MGFRLSLLTTKTGEFKTRSYIRIFPLNDFAHFAFFAASFRIKFL